jgi:competence protein ComEC
LGDRPVFFPTLAFLLGVALMPTDSSSWLLLWGSGLAAMAVAWLVDRRTGSWLLGVVGIGVLGAGAASFRAERTASTKQHVVLDAVVEEVSTTPERSRLLLDVTRADASPVAFRVLLSSDAPLDVAAGQRVLVPANLRILEEAANPGERDRVRFLRRKGVSFVGGFSAQRLVVLTAASKWRSFIEAQRRSLAVRIKDLGDSSEASEFLIALSTGDRSELSDDVSEAFATSGLAHVLSVSGLHVAVIALTLFACLRWALSRRLNASARRWSPHALAAPFSIPCVWLYVVFTGAEPPAVRSGLMCTVWLLGHVLRRRPDPLNTLVGTGLAMLAFEPEAILDVSVQLSFTSVAALILLAPTLEVLPTRATSLEDPRAASWTTRAALQAKRTLIQTLGASVSVVAATAPILASTFHRLSLAGIVSNIVTLPVAGPLTLLSAIGAAVHAVSPAASDPILWLGLRLSTVFVSVAEFFGSLPGASILVREPNTLMLTAYLVSLTVATLAAGVHRRLAWTAVAAILVFLAQHPQAARRGLEVTFLSVGHGDAIVVSADGHHALIDGGGVPNGADTGRRVVIPYLKHQGIRSLDFVALTHAHPDHALGLVSILEEMSVRQLWLPEGVADGPLIDDVMEASDTAEIWHHSTPSDGLTLGGATIEVLSPRQVVPPDSSENNRSLVLLLRYGEVSVLLTGDIEAEAENTLELPSVTLLKAPHHGSNTSSTQSFVDKAKPRYVVFSVGGNNRFGFPRHEVVDRYRSIGARCFRTDVSGALTFHSDGRHFEIQGTRPVIDVCQPGAQSTSVTGSDTGAAPERAITAQSENL